MARLDDLERFEQEEPGDEGDVDAGENRDVLPWGYLDGYGRRPSP